MTYAVASQVAPTPCIHTGNSGSSLGHLWVTVNSPSTDSDNGETRFEEPMSPSISSSTSWLLVTFASSITSEQPQRIITNINYCRSIVLSVICCLVGLVQKDLRAKPSMKHNAVRSMSQMLLDFYSLHTAWFLIYHCWSSTGGYVSMASGWFTKIIQINIFIMIRKFKQWW